MVIEFHSQLRAELIRSERRTVARTGLIGEGRLDPGRGLAVPFPGPQGRPVQQYIRFADSEAPFTERLATYRWRGHHFEAQIVTRAKDGTTCRFMQAG